VSCNAFGNPNPGGARFCNECATPLAALCAAFEPTIRRTPVGHSPIPRPPSNCGDLLFAAANQKRIRTTQLGNRENTGRGAIRTRNPQSPVRVRQGPSPKTPRRYGVLGGHSRSGVIVSDDAD
jgi:hypothetical protein